MKVQSESAQKDQVITKLQSDVTTLQTTQASLAKVSPDRVAALEATVLKLQGNK